MTDARHATFEEELALHGRFVFTGSGRSMLPLIREERDLVLIERRPTDESGQPLRLRKYDVALYRRGDRYILHRVLRVLPEGYVICGDHNWQREYDVGDGQIIGVMTAFVRDGVEIPVTDRRYLRYVRLWCDLFPVRAAVLFAAALPGRVLRRLRRIAE